MQSRVAIRDLLHRVRVKHLMKGFEDIDDLHFAVQRNDLDKVMNLVEGGIPINAFDCCDKTAFHYAVEDENFRIAQYLLEHGADVDPQDIEKSGCTPLGNAGATCSPKMAKFLVKHGSNVSAPGWMQISAIHRAFG